MDYITSIHEGWRDLMDNKSDPRTSEWLLMSSPFPTIAISLSYAYFVKVRIWCACSTRNRQLLGDET